MKTESLRATMLLLLLVAAGCGGSSPVKPTVSTASCVPSSKPALAYVLTGNNTISSYTVNSCTGELTSTNPPTVATNGNQFGAEDMAVDPSGRFVYVANLMSNATDLATIAMFTINSSTGVLTPTTPPTVPTGFFPQGIGIDPSGKFVYTANSDDNSVSMFTINQSTGVLTPTTPPTVAAGWSPGSVTVDPSGRFAYVANQIDGSISMYTVDSVTGVLTPMTPATVPAGGSPFAITVDPSGKFAYVPNAYDANNAVSEYTVDPASGILTPTSQGFATAGNSPTFVAVDPASKFAYVVNRQDKTISAYAINSSTGDLSLIGTLGAGAQPWRSAVDPSGQFVYVADEGGSILSYKINHDGSLSAAGTTVTGGSACKITVIAPK